ncbi:uncharacterized protein ASPGLDRAFT_489921 [Aspergillus glaucus CBS 516.65]|uniref:Uncharacterized protein n=1 Tax=Aspergillus glaucus CBS 516.65 TaxID=1160497 RepID=A0A1L9VFM2_ASPGL|nr:hypothetical protein ASPGLDRAFT_489921 [Aspergillus glaucus CBS 516.65]OJJ82737.1 hypothetical protein ASPGLDRAFT_489921 [Aspergillus glaucus CBS 516.65]
MSNPRTSEETRKLFEAMRNNILAVSEPSACKPPGPPLSPEKSAKMHEYLRVLRARRRRHRSLVWRTWDSLCDWVGTRKSLFWAIIFSYFVLFLFCFWYFLG